MSPFFVCLLIGMSASAGLSDAQCLGAAAGWQLSYADDIGVCYYLRDSVSRVQVNYSTSMQWCLGSTTVPGLTALRLSRMITEQQQTLAVRALTSAGIGYWNIWTEATCNTSTGMYTWSSGLPVSDLKHITCNSSAAVQLIGEVVPATDGSYKVTSQISAINVQSLGTTLCEYDVPRCNMSTLSNFNATRMQPDVEPVAGRAVKAACAPGYYRAAEADGTPESKVRNRFDCQYVPDSSIGTARLVAKNNSNSVVDACSMMHCAGGDLLNVSLQGDFKDSYKTRIDSSREYLFGESIPVECKTGYVKIMDLSDVNSTINCIQNDLKPSEGQWDPIFCTPVGCNRSAMSGAFNPDTMQMYKAYDRLKDVTYSDAETHKFSYYPNTVYVRCKTSGEFFEDRKYDKTFQCNLLPNSTIKAGWNPVEGTLESSMKCKAITCLTNEIVTASYRSTIQDYLTTGNFNSTVTVTDDTGLSVSMTLKDFVSTAEYKYSYTVRFDCNSGYAMSTVNETDGKMVSISNLTTQCSPLGSWSKIISSCIKMSAAIDATSGKKYVPDPTEAGSAQSLGAIVIVILSVFFSVVVVLDLATLSRDIKLLKRNLRRLRLKAKMKKSE